MWGVASRPGPVKEFLERATAEGSWLFGVHVQGNLAWLPEWPLQPWQSFVMWPDETTPFMRSLPPTHRVDLNCVNFLPDADLPLAGAPKRWDVCVVSRASPVKRIVETLQLVRAMLDRDPMRTFVLVVPDDRRLELGTKTYERNGIERAYYELPRTLFSARELNQISFVSASVESFGRMPLAAPLLLQMISDSRLLLLPSHSEGTPRVIAEALMVGTPCAISESLESGITRELGATESIAISDDPAAAGAQIVDALEHYDRFHVDTERARDRYGATANKPRLLARLEELVESRDEPVEGEWLLDDLHVRLAGHGQKENYQLMNDDRRFFQWLDHAEHGDPFDEDEMFARIGTTDREQLTPARRARRLAGRLRRSLR
jgi:glycosyltransferase involved in cell wall biosynthesis